MSLKAFKLWSKVPPVMNIFMEKNFSNKQIQIMQSQKEGFKLLLEKEHYEKVYACKLCQILFPPEKLSHKLTLKMLIQAEKQMKVKIDNKLASRGKYRMVTIGRI